MPKLKRPKKWCPASPEICSKIWFWLGIEWTCFIPKELFFLGNGGLGGGHILRSSFYMRFLNWVFIRITHSSIFSPIAGIEIKLKSRMECVNGAQKLCQYSFICRWEEFSNKHSFFKNSSHKISEKSVVGNDILWCWVLDNLRKL